MLTLGALESLFVIHVRLMTDLPPYCSHCQSWPCLHYQRDPQPKYRAPGVMRRYIAAPAGYTAPLTNSRPPQAYGPQDTMADHYIDQDPLQALHIIVRDGRSRLWQYLSKYGRGASVHQSEVRRLSIGTHKYSILNAVCLLYVARRTGMFRIMRHIFLSAGALRVYPYLLSRSEPRLLYTYPIGANLWCSSYSASANVINGIPVPLLRLPFAEHTGRGSRYHAGTINISAPDAFHSGMAQPPDVNAAVPGLAYGTAQPMGRNSQLNHLDGTSQYLSSLPGDHAPFIPALANIQHQPPIAPTADVQQLASSARSIMAPNSGGFLPSYEDAQRSFACYDDNGPTCVR